MKAGKLKAIGVTSLGRSPLAPEYPRLNELGIRGFQLEIWIAAAAPNSMPKPIAQKLSTLIAGITRTPEVRGKLFQQGWQAAGTSAEGLANRIQADTARARRRDHDARHQGGVIRLRGRAARQRRRAAGLLPLRKGPTAPRMMRSRTSSTVAPITAPASRRGVDGPSRAPAARAWRRWIRRR